MSFPYPNNSELGNHFPIIFDIVKYTNCKKYLELGVLFGDNISPIANIVNKAIGVDSSDNRKYHNFDFHLTTTDEFFKNNKETFDIIFIDADHSYESVKKDLENALLILNKHGIILLHDTDPMTEIYTLPGACNDSYKILEYIYNKHKELDVINLPINEAGLTILNRKSENRFKNYIK